MSVSLPSTRPVSGRFLLSVAAVIALAWAVLTASWTIEDHFVTRREFATLSADVRAIRASLDARDQDKHSALTTPTQ